MENKMMEMWDNRYASEDYAYGTKPNRFLKNTIEKLQLTGSILFGAEGEGRNAVFAAKQGLEVTAFDISNEGKQKALKLAAKEHVHIDYQLGSLFDLDLSKQKYDIVALIFAHFPPPILSKYHTKLGQLVKDGGIIILEGFSKGHLPYRTANPQVGGPNNLEMLFSKESIKQDFPDFAISRLEEVEIELNEGIYHNGIGKVIQFIGRKK